MSRAFRNIQGLLIVFLITLCLLAVCNMQTVYADENTEAVSINIPESIEINKYTVYTLDPEILPLSADQHFNVESSNPNVVQANISGIGETANLLGVSEGHATVTVSTNNGLTASAEVTVLPVNEPTYISLNEEYTLKEYDHSYIYPNVDCDTLYSITVDDNSVVSTFGGGSGLLYKDNYYMQSVGLIAQSPGTTTFTIETINGLSCSATVTVNEAENPTSITIPDQCELKEGDVWDVPITLAPEGVFSVYSIWADDGSIVTTATTGVGDGCRIFAKKAGKTNVTIMTRNQLYAVCEVTVSHDWDDSYTVDIEPTCAKGLESIHCRYCGQTKEAREIDPIKEHKWNEEYTVDKEASCTEEGSKSKHCSVCGVIDETTVTVIPKADHTYGDWKVTKEATCAEDGSKEKVCSVCEDKVTEAIRATGHKWNEEYTVDKEASCKEEGSKSIHCSVCDAVDESTVTVIPKSDHTYGDWTVTKEATCTEDGSKEKVCEVCDDKVTEVIPATGHQWNEDYTVDKEATCTEEGSKSKHCSVCNAIDETTVTVIPKADHTYGDWKVTKEATCAEDGSKEKVCSVCEDKVTEAIRATGHKWNEEYTVDNEASCKEEGSKSIHCSVCNAIDESTVTVIPKSDHTYGDWTVTKEAACTEDGSKEKVCEVCDDKVTKVIPATGHSFSEDYVIDTPASCTTDGSKSRHCAHCDEITDVTVIPATGHTFGEWVEVTSSTCENEGLRQHTCEVCGTVESENLDPKGHDFDEEYTIDVPATCTTDGSQSRHCKNCDVVTDSEVIPATGHSFGDWDVTKEATCVETGLKERVCSVCSEKETEIIPLTDHRWETNPTVDKAATCEEDGSQSIHCAICGAKDESTVKVIPKTGHDWNEPTYAWSDDNSTVTATRTCRNDSSHKESETEKTTSEVTKAATYTAKGETTYTVVFDNEVFTKQTKTVADIPVLERTSIQKATVSRIVAKVYTGKALTQAPTVKVGTKTLKSGTDYKLTYKNNKNVGKATVTITGIGAYKGTISKTFKINPKGTSLKTLTKASKAATIKWTKQATKMSLSRITGYQIQLATDSKFTKNKKTVTVKGYSKVSKKVTGLKGAKKYYVRIRTYKTVSGTNYYSSWSKVKTVTTKK